MASFSLHELKPGDRYDVEGDGMAVHKEDGRYVRFTDYEALRQQLATVEASRGNLQQHALELMERLAAAEAERDRAVKEVKAARDLAEQWNADARAEGFGGGAVKARDLLDAMNAAIAAAAGDAGGA